MASLRQIAKELGITPAYLSYMVNGKRPWRADLFERYSQLVNTSVNSERQTMGTKNNGLSTKTAHQVSNNLRLAGGSARESNPPTPLVTRHNGFEVRKSHRAPSTPPWRGRAG